MVNAHVVNLKEKVERFVVNVPTEFVPKSLVLPQLAAFVPPLDVPQYNMSVGFALPVEITLALNVAALAVIPVAPPPLPTCNDAETFKVNPAIAKNTTMSFFIFMPPVR